jgi:hypothetical protein
MSTPSLTLTVSSQYFLGGSLALILGTLIFIGSWRYLYRKYNSFNNKHHWIFFCLWIGLFLIISGIVVITYRKTLEDLTGSGSTTKPVTITN